MGRPRPARRAAAKATGDPHRDAEKKGRAQVAPLLLLTSRAALALPFYGEPLRREGRRRLEQGGGEGSTLTHTRSICTALLLPAPPWDSPVGDVASPTGGDEAGGELYAGGGARVCPRELRSDEAGGELRAGSGRSRGSEAPVDRGAKGHQF
ncbi:hypothetical protein C2845_PM02G41930 [Panicum miliaceum]|uniref:Uncharacterized protein n=1 Tax=Panicum miliaceum TaxID=4540 RepID=A0A3L6SEP9_PANMI|nr:hypothetical protein C2845_PM02G41930 [Panicum miliaceum]